MDVMCVENVLNGTEGIYRNYLFRENVLCGTESWFLTMAWVYPLTPNPQQACHGISIRRSLGDKGLPTLTHELEKQIVFSCCHIMYLYLFKGTYFLVILNTGFFP